MLKKKPDAAPAKSDAKLAGVPSLISADVEIEGNFTSRGEVQFDGAITGDLRADGLVIGEGATVRGEVAAERVRVCGHVVGVIRATRVDLAATARIEGDVMHAALTVEDGAKLDGKVCCMEAPLAKAKPAAPQGSAQKAGGLDAEKVAAELAEQPVMRAAAGEASQKKRAA